MDAEGILRSDPASLEETLTEEFGREQGDRGEDVNCESQDAAKEDNGYSLPCLGYIANDAPQLVRSSAYDFAHAAVPILPLVPKSSSGLRAFGTSLRDDGPDGSTTQGIMSLKSSLFLARRRSLCPRFWALPRSSCARLGAHRYHATCGHSRIADPAHVTPAVRLGPTSPAK